jgi:hypothetical protein
VLSRKLVEKLGCLDLPIVFVRFIQPKISRKKLKKEICWYLPTFKSKPAKRIFSILMVDFAYHKSTSFI